MALKLAVAALPALVGLALVGAPSQAASVYGSCQDVEVPVALAHGPRINS
jgi:hypothetical protein